MSNPLTLPLELNKKHIQHAQLVVNRTEQLHLLPKNSTVVEIGVQFGHYSKKILEIVTPSNRYLVEINKKYCKNLRKKFKKYIQEGIVEIINESSFTAHERFPEKYFDFIYIDGNHSYTAASKDIKNFYKKIKDGGFMVLNDYILYDYIRPHLNPYGVMQAVNEFCINNNWEIIYYTLNTNDFKDVILREIPVDSIYFKKN